MCVVSVLPVKEVKENVINGFAIHYLEVDELRLPIRYCKQNFDDENDAWEFASKFAKEMWGKVVDVYVVFSLDKTPVEDYELKKISNFDAFSFKWK